MDGARVSHDQVVKELSGSASVRPSQIKKAAPPVAPKPKVVSQKGPEIQMTSSYDDFPMPPPQHMMFTTSAADDLPPPPPPIDAEFSITANGQPLNSGVMSGGSSGAGTGRGSGVILQQPAAVVGGSSQGSAGGMPSFVVRPVAPAGTTVSITPGARLGPRPFVSVGGKATVGGGIGGTGTGPSSSINDGPAYHGRSPAAPVVDEPLPPPPLLSASTAAPARPVGSTLPFISSGLSSAGSPGGGGASASSASGTAAPSKPYTSSTTILLGSGNSAAQPFPSSSPAASQFTDSAATGQSHPRQPAAPAPQHAGAKPQPTFDVNAGAPQPATGGRATVDLSFVVGPGSSGSDVSGNRGAPGGLSPPKPVLATTAPSSSAGSVTIKPTPQPGGPGSTPANPASAAAAAAQAKPKTSHETELDSLTDQLMRNLDATNDPTCLAICAHCNKKISADSAMCTAMDRPYHIECFACCSCKKLLTGQSFYLVRNEPQCEACYTSSLEKCTACQQPITDRILRATGKAYHARCFTCVVCNRSLDGVPFTVDSENKVHCVEDFHKKYAPRCSVCNEPIMPEEGQEETVRIVALDRNFHIKCYKCEDCGLLLSSEAEGRGCYPLDGHVLCRSCYSKRSFEKTTGGISQQPQAVPASDF